MAESKPEYGRRGSIIYIVAIVILTLALMGTALVAYSLFNSRQDYKNNSDQKASAAVNQALATQKAQLQQQFAEQSKSPYLTFTGPPVYGSITFNYPRTWNGYVDQTGTTDPLVGFFYNGIVPPEQTGVNFPLKLSLLGDDYTTVINSFNQNIQSGDVKASAYIPPKMAKVTNAQVGTRLDGQIDTDSQGNAVQGSMVILKVRDKTLEISTQSPNFISDFNNTILASLTFAP